MKRLCLGLALLMCWIAMPLWAVPEYFNPSQIGGSAEMIRIGNIEGFSDKSYVVFENPASLHALYKFSGSMFTTTFMDEVVYRNYSVAMRLPKGVLGIGYMSAGVEGIPKTDLSGIPTVIPDGIRPEDLDEVDIIQTGTYKYLNQLIKLSYQISQSRRLHWGASLSLFSTELERFKGDGTNIDLGMYYRGRRNHYSVVAKNAISSMKVSYNNGGEEELPLNIVFGLKRRYGDIDVFGQAQVYSARNKFGKSFGAAYHPRFLGGLTLSAGYKEWPLAQSIDGQFKHIIKSNITMGVGLALNGIYFDYAYESSEHKLYNSKHYFSVGFAF